MIQSKDITESNEQNIGFKYPSQRQTIRSKSSDKKNAEDQMQKSFYK